MASVAPVAPLRFKNPSQSSYASSSSSSLLARQELRLNREDDGRQERDCSEAARDHGEGDEDAEEDVDLEEGEREAQVAAGDGTRDVGDGFAGGEQRGGGC